MKAIVIHAAHDLRLEDREAGIPGPGEVAIAVKRGGICGSDLHYYNHGGFGVVRLKEPMILGHEIAGEVTALGKGVTGLSAGDIVAVSPSRPCGQCRFCQQGLQNHCLDMLFYGSAMRFPHVQGAFSQHLVALASQCHKIAPGTRIELAAFAEPFAVTLHAINRAGPLIGRRLLVSLPNVTQRVDADLEFSRIMPSLRARLAVQIHHWPEPVRLPTDDRYH